MKLMDIDRTVTCIDKKSVNICFYNEKGQIWKNLNS